MRGLRRASLERIGGFTLVEVMITVFVTAIGLLTVAGLQAAAKKANFEATQRSTASALAQDMIERMRANPTMWSSYDGVTDATKLSAGTNCADPALASPCSPAQIVAYDIYQWGQKLLGSEETVGAGTAGTSGLLNPTGCIRFMPDGNFRVAIAWQGLTSMTPPSSADPLYDACGLNGAAYADAGGTANALRRVLFIEFL